VKGDAKDERIMGAHLLLILWECKS